MEELEKIRIKIKNRYNTILIAMIVSIVVLTIIAIILQAPELLAGIVVPLDIGVLELVMTTFKSRSMYDSIFKKTVVIKALESIFTDFTYDPEKGIPRQQIADTNMMHMGDSYHSEDYISGKYKGIQFEQSDVHIEEKHTSIDVDGHTTTTYETIFKGRWMIFDFNKNFKSDVQIEQKGFGNSKVHTFFGKKDNLFKKVYMESESFNSKFNVYAQDEHTAFYIITPSLMNRIETLIDATKGKFLLLCFVNNHLHIGIYDDRNAFESPSVFKEIDEEEQIQKVSADIKMITKFVDELNLDNTLFKN